MRPSGRRKFALRERGYWGLLVQSLGRVPVLSIILTMLVILAIAGVVVLYVAFPHRGEDVPHTPWVGEALRKGVHALPTIDNQRSWERGHQHQ